MLRTLTRSKLLCRPNKGSIEVPPATVIERVESRGKLDLVRAVTLAMDEDTTCGKCFLLRNQIGGSTLLPKSKSVSPP